jgi:DNA helicase-2/ATP-dependent DNA helicase PcrA
MSTEFASNSESSLIRRWYDHRATEEGKGVMPHEPGLHRVPYFRSSWHLTGKTTYLSKQIGLAADKYGSDRVLVTSFTRAAAAELVGRDLPIPRDNIGTLHAHCYRALGNPEIAELKIDEWNKDHPKYAVSQTSGKGALDEGAVDQTYQQPADELFAHMQSLRARMIPVAAWPSSVQALAKLWEAWKADNGLIDFTDLLEMALRDIRIAPGDPAVLIADEAQDFSKLQLSLIRQWGKHAEYMLVAGDEDQLLYGWCGCTVDAFLKPAVPETQKRVLRQSFRVPRAVHALAIKWAEKLTVREPKEYLPRDFDGEIRACSHGHWRAPQAVLADAEKYLAQGKTVMFLASCSYMLDPIRDALRAEGMPFHNPYRRARGDWNPLRNAESGTSTAARMLAFLRPRDDVWGEDCGEWTADELRRWVEIVKSDGLLARGAKGAITAMTPDATITVETLATLFEPEAADTMIAVLSQETLEECVRWLQNRILAAKRKAAEYPAAVLLKHGPRALFEKPQIILGTIHSVKGGEADVVYLFPDLSRAGMVEWSAAGERRDAIIRQFYVGMTRARETLILCQPATTWHVPMGVQ